MIKLSHIDIDFDKQYNTYIYIAHVIADKPEEILVLRDYIYDNNGEYLQEISSKLNKTFVYRNKPLSEEKVSGKITLRYYKREHEIEEAVDNIAQLILSFIL